MAVTDDEIPQQVRVRTDSEDGLAYRYDTIQEAARRIECNKTDAIVNACDVAGPIVDGIEEALVHPDLHPSLAEKLAQMISSRHVQIEYSAPDFVINPD